MDKRSRKLYGYHILAAALDRFGVDPATVRELGGFESFVYEVVHESQPCIFRVSHNLHNSPERILAEMEFLDYLGNHGLRVSIPRRSRNGKWVETIPVPSDEVPDSMFSAVLFDKASGHPPRREDWTPGLVQAMGSYLGKLHALSNRYEPTLAPRHHWYQDQEEYSRYLPEDQTLIRERFDVLIRHLKSLPRNPDGYGLAHLDFHGSNFFIDPEGRESRITLFDFDDCAYAPYIYDIAMALFYVVPHRCETPEAQAHASSFIHEFMRGYNRHYRLNAAWFAELPNFLKLREFDIYMILHRSRDLSQLGSWEASFMDGRRERLENDNPYIPIEFPGSLANLEPVPAE